MKKLQYWIYRMIRFGFQLFYPKTELAGQEHLPEEPCIIVSNHCKLNGPAAGTLYFPEPRYIWCTWEMMDLKEVPAYAFQDFWSHKPKWSHWLYRLLSYFIAPFCVCLFTYGPSIAVYRDQRVISTFRETIHRLQEGSNVIIFPEHHAPYDHIHNDFQNGFVDVARSYYKQTGKALQFVPMYLAPELHKMVLGEPIAYDPQAPHRGQRQRICDYLMAEISSIACSLPRHKVVPYPNLPKKKYVYNIPEEETPHEKACC